MFCLSIVWGEFPRYFRAIAVLFKLQLGFHMRYSAANAVVAAVDNSSPANRRVYSSMISPGFPDSEAIEDPSMSGLFRINGSSDISPASARSKVPEGVGILEDEVL